MKKERKVGVMKRLWADALPFVSQSLEMKLDWLVGVIKKKKLSRADIAPYMRLLIMEYNGGTSYAMPDERTGQDFIDLFRDIDRDVARMMIDSTDLSDIPSLLEFLPELNVEDVVVILTKRPLPYEKKPRLLIDRVFHTVYGRCPTGMFEEAAELILKRGICSEHFGKSYQRFKDIKEDEKILSALYPRAGEGR